MPFLSPHLHCVLTPTLPSSEQQKRRASEWQSVSQPLILVLPFTADIRGKCHFPPHNQCCPGAQLKLSSGQERVLQAHYKEFRDR